MKEAAARKYQGIEILRFLCAFAVVVWHYQGFFTNGVLTFSGRMTEPFYVVLKPMYDQGLDAVMIFWVISGFIFFWKYAEPIHFRKITPGKFFVLRMSRLYPLHLATLLAVAALQPLYKSSHGTYFVCQINDAYHFVLNLLFASFWGLQKGYSFNSPTWSVSIEILAYVVFFIAARFVRFSLWKTLIFLAIFLFFSKLCLSLFFLGGLLYYLYEKIESHEKTTRMRLGLVAVIACILFYAALYFPLGYKDYYTTDLGRSVFANFKYYLFSSLLIISFAVLPEIIGNAVFLEKFATLGNLTYSSYLIHFPLQITLVLITDWIGLSREFYNHRSVFILYNLIVFTSAYYVYHKFEFPRQEQIRAWFYVKSRAENLPILRK